MPVDLDAAPLVGIGFAVDVHAIGFSFLEPHAVDEQRRCVAVIDLHLRRRAALRREDGVETQRIGRERQTKRRVVTRAVLATAREEVQRDDVQCTKEKYVA